jgi:hypothetical protein
MSYHDRCLEYISQLEGGRRPGSSPRRQALATMAFGAVGSDNVAMELTHRVTVGSTLKIGSGGSKREPGVSLADDARNLRIEIGDIAILEQLQGDGVGGILGIDALMRCSKVLFRFGGRLSENELMLYE